MNTIHTCINWRYRVLNAIMHQTNQLCANAIRIQLAGCLYQNRLSQLLLCPFLGEGGRKGGGGGSHLVYI